MKTYKHGYASFFIRVLPREAKASSIAIGDECDRAALSDSNPESLRQDYFPIPLGIPIVVPGEAVMEEAVKYWLLVHQADGFTTAPKTSAYKRRKMVDR